MCKKLQYLKKLEASYIHCTLPNLSHMYVLRNLTELKLHIKYSPDAPWYGFDETEMDSFCTKFYREWPELKIFNSIDFEKVVDRVHTYPVVDLDKLRHPCEVEECYAWLGTGQDV